jgi:2-amino-4-hydroxy-6-hydroxymethyldihydropteridine diphosphokinase
MVLACSKFIDTEPLAADAHSAPQPRYLNGVLRCETKLQPEAILSNLLTIEKELGRVRGVTDVKWGPRTIDLDLIAVDNVVLKSPTLTLPHPEMHKRRFVLEPLLEIAPEWIHPLLGKSVRELFLSLVPPSNG